MRACCVCGAHLNDDHVHRHEDPGWKPAYDDFEGALEGYETATAPTVVALDKQEKKTT